jgi:hypothetical protein
LAAEAQGTVVHHRTSSNGILSVDLRLNSLTINGTSVPLPEQRFLRVEIFRGWVSVKKTLFKHKDAVIFTRGKLVWDNDGWFEIHPQTTADVGLVSE